jgi:urate oxidase
MAVTLGHNQYGKAEVHLVRVTRHEDTNHDTNHDIKDVTVTTQLYGDFEECHRTGANANLIATDTQKNTVFGLAQKHNVGAIEDFGQLLIRNFMGELPAAVRGGHAIIEEQAWARIPVDGPAGGHSFVKGGGDQRFCAVTIDGEQTWITAGIKDLVVLKSTGSEFWGFPKTQYTSLTETDDRILATAVKVSWRYNSVDVDWDASFAAIKPLVLSTFARIHSLSLQQTLFGIGEAIIEARPEVDEVRLSMPNKHHFLVDLSPYGQENPNEVFYATDKYYGLIDAVVLREGVETQTRAWDAQRGIC